MSGGWTDCAQRCVIAPTPGPGRPSGNAGSSGARRGRETPPASLPLRQRSPPSSSSPYRCIGCGHGRRRGLRLPAKFLRCATFFLHPLAQSFSVAVSVSVSRLPLALPSSVGVGGDGPTSHPGPKPPAAPCRNQLSAHLPSSHQPPMPTPRARQRHRRISPASSDGLGIRMKKRVRDCQGLRSSSIVHRRWHKHESINVISTGKDGDQHR